MGKVPSSSTGELAKFLRGQSRFLPSGFQKGYLEAVERGEIKSMPNRRDSLEDSFVNLNLVLLYRLPFEV